MRYVDRQLAFLIVLLILPLLFMPKIALISCGDDPGIRLDDFCILTAFFVILFSHYHSKTPLSRIETSILTFTLLSLVSVGISKGMELCGVLQSSGNFLYSFRFFEYFVFFYAGLSLTQFIRIEKIVFLLLFENLLVAVLQKNKIIGGYVCGQYISDASGHVIGIASGDYELGLLLLVIFSFFLSQNKRRSFFHLQDSLLFLSILLILLYCGSRISIISVAVVFFIKKIADLLREKKGGVILFFGGVVYLLFLGVWFLFSDLPGINRFAKVLDFSNLHIFVEVYNQANLEDKSYFEFVKQVKLSRVDANFDMSWYMRTYKWSYMIKLFVYNLYALFLGIGPGYFGSATDGGWLRLFIEHGIVGAITFLTICYRLVRLDSSMIWFFLGFSVNMIFIDTYMAYKGVSVFFFIAGAKSLDGWKSSFSSIDLSLNSSRRLSPSLVS